MINVLEPGTVIDDDIFKHPPFSTRDTGKGLSTVYLSIFFA